MTLLTGSVTDIRSAEAGPPNPDQRSQKKPLEFDVEFDDNKGKIVGIKIPYGITLNKGQSVEIDAKFSRIIEK